MHTVVVDKNFTVFILNYRVKTFKVTALEEQVIQDNALLFVCLS